MIYKQHLQKLRPNYVISLFNFNILLFSPLKHFFIINNIADLELERKKIDYNFKNETFVLNQDLSGNLSKLKILISDFSK